MDQIGNKIKVAIELLREKNGFTGINKSVIAITEITYNYEIVPLDENVIKVGSETIYFEDIKNVRYINADFTCRIITISNFSINCFKTYVKPVISHLNYFNS